MVDFSHEELPGFFTAALSDLSGDITDRAHDVSNPTIGSDNR